MAITNPSTLLASFDENETNISAPPTEQINDGYVVNEIPASENHGYMFNEWYKWLNYYKKNGMAQYDATLSYNKHSRVMRNQNIYRSLSDANSGNDPLSSPTFWMIDQWRMNTATHDMTSDANYTLTGEQNNFGKVIITDTNPFLTLPRDIIVSDEEKDFIVFNNTLQVLTLKTNGGSGIAVTAGAKVWLLCDGTNVIDSIDNAVSGGVPGVRQTVQTSSVDANGFSNYITAGTGLAVDIAATSIPVTIHASNSAVSNDRLGTISADTSISALTDATTNYLYADIAAEGTVTLGSTVLAPVYQFGGTYSVTSGQATFNISEMTMKVGNGASADIVNRVFLGEAVTAGGVVTSVVNYALNGLYEAPLGTILNATQTQVLLSHNLGVEGIPTFRIRCNTAEINYAIGDIVNVATNLAGAVVQTLSVDKKTISFITNTTTLAISNKTTSTMAAITLSRWDYIPTVKRGW